MTSIQTTIETADTIPDFSGHSERIRNNNTPLDIINFIEHLLIQGVIKIVKTVEGTSLGDNLDSLINNTNPILREGALKLIRGKGEGASYTTAAILSAMMAGCSKDEVFKNIRAVSLVQAQHSFELVVDHKALAVFDTPERIAAYTYLNELAVANALGDEHVLLETGRLFILDEKLKDFQYRVAIKAAEYINKLGMFKPLLNLFNVSLDAFGDPKKLSADKGAKLVTLEHLIQMHLNSVRALREYVKATGDENTANIDDFTLNAEANRYIGVQRSMERGGYKRLKADQLDEAIQTREWSIMIELTAGMLLHDIAKQNAEVCMYLKDSVGFTVFKEGVESATKLIGLWNDCGSHILRMSTEEIDDLFNEFKSLDKDAPNLRAALAPKKFIQEYKSTEDITTAQLAELRAKHDKRKGLRHEHKVAFWKNYVQLIKDAADDEENLLLDFGIDTLTEGENAWDHQLQVIYNLNAVAKNLELNLGDIINNNIKLDGQPVPIMPQIIVEMLGNMARFHAQIYSAGDEDPEIEFEGGDYYGSNNVQVVNGLPVMNKKLWKKDYRINQGRRYQEN